MRTHTSRIIKPLATFLVLLGTMSQAVAETFCVETGDELHDTLVIAQGNNQDDVIKLQVKTFSSFYSLPPLTEFSFIIGDNDMDNSVNISGGWNSDCSAQLNDPSRTVLNGRGLSPVLRFIPNFGSIEFSGSIAISNLTIANGLAVVNGLRTAALSVGLQNMTVNSSVLIENIVVNNNRSEATSNNVNAVDLLFAGSGGSARFRNNVIYGNNFSGAGDARMIHMSVTGNVLSYLSNNSVFGNTGTGAVSGLFVEGVVTLSNNVIVQTTSSAPGQGVDFRADNAATMSLRNNHLGSTFYGNNSQPASNIATTTGDPQWSGIGFFRVPNPGSPLLDSGYSTALGGLAPNDVRGVPRIQNGTVDRGSVEALPAANTGPNILALEPLNNSTTTLNSTNDGFQITNLYFNKESGNGIGETTINCEVTAGNAVITLRPFQIVKNVSLIPLPVEVALNNPAPGSGNDNSTVVCQVVRENANSFALTYQFVVRDPLIFAAGFE